MLHADAALLRNCNDDFHVAYASIVIDIDFMIIALPLQPPGFRCAQHRIQSVPNAILSEPDLSEKMIITIMCTVNFGP